MVHLVTFVNICGWWVGLEWENWPLCSREMRAKGKGQLWHDHLDQPTHTHCCCIAQQFPLYGSIKQCYNVLLFIHGPFDNLDMQLLWVVGGIEVRKLAHLSLKRSEPKGSCDMTICIWTNQPTAAVLLNFLCMALSKVIVWFWTEGSNISIKA
jgi:hypothetical protein